MVESLSYVEQLSFEFIGGTLGFSEEPCYHSRTMDLEFVEVGRNYVVKG